MIIPGEAMSIGLRQGSLLEVRELAGGAVMRHLVDGRRQAHGPELGILDDALDSRTTAIVEGHGVQTAALIPESPMQHIGAHEYTVDPTARLAPFRGLREQRPFQLVFVDPRVDAVVEGLRVLNNPASDEQRTAHGLLRLAESHLANGDGGQALQALEEAIATNALVGDGPALAANAAFRLRQQPITGNLSAGDLDRTTSWAQRMTSSAAREQAGTLLL